MKQQFIAMALLLSGFVGCNTAPEPIKIDNELTAEEVAAARLTPEVMWKMSRIGGHALSPDGTTLLYTLTRYNMEENRGVTVIVSRDLATGEEKELTDTSSNSVSPIWGADGKSIWFASNRGGEMQLWQMQADGSQPKQVSNIEGGIEGFGISPDERHIYYTQFVHAKDINSADVHKDMAKSKARIYDDLMVRHWDYWDSGKYLHIFVADLLANGVGTATDITGEKSAWDTPLAPYFDHAEIAWSPDGKQLAYTCKPLTGAKYAVSTDSDIFIYDLESGETKNICKGNKAFAFVGYDKYPVWSPSGSKIAFRSQERAGNEADKERLMIYDLTSGEVKYLTKNFDYHATNVVWSSDETTIYFIAPIEATHQICSVKADGTGEVEVLTKGDHDINSFEICGGRCVGSVMTISMAPELFEFNLTNGSMTKLTAVNDFVYDNIKMGEVQKRWVKTTDGKKMLTWVILPPDFDATKKYPTLLYCQGGPQSVVSQFWSYRWNFQLMAAQGYVVVAPNRRGVPSFGQEWLDQISGDYSGQNIRDYLSAIDDVAKEKWCDKERLGCVGASYGGYSVFYLAGHHQKRFKAFIAHCGIFNFESMYGHTEEMFFVNNDYGGAYWDKNNKTAMRSYANSPHKAVDKWDTPILIFTGEKDYRIPYTQSLEAFTAARLRGIPSRLVSFENEAHQVFKPQNSLVWNREFFGWLERYLK
ncbi:MAG: S9 family peptidase [Rikenellaceae bacterium]|nr:S9 family peptidase [Rikenellaceae bacterium]